MIESSIGAINTSAEKCEVSPIMRCGTRLGGNSQIKAGVAGDKKLKETGEYSFDQSEVDLVFLSTNQNKSRTFCNYFSSPTVATGISICYLLLFCAALFHSLFLQNLSAKCRLKIYTTPPKFQMTRATKSGNN